jgi:4-hydroxybenzoate polyprenyltransferase
VPAGLVRRSTAASIAAVAAALGLGLAMAAGPPTLVVAVAGLATGVAYDLRLKGTRWSWAPYAIGVPLLPVFAWVGATGTLPAPFVVLVPLAMLAGAALAVANSVADLERDRAAGISTVATSLGLGRARRIGGALSAVVISTALVSAAALGGSVGWLVVAGAGAAIVVAGLALGWNRGPDARRRAWEVQGAGMGIIAAGWLGSLAAAGLLAG